MVTLSYPVDLSHCIFLAVLMPTELGHRRARNPGPLLCAEGKSSVNVEVGHAFGAHTVPTQSHVEPASLSEPSRTSWSFVIGFSRTGRGHQGQQEQQGRQGQQGQQRQQPSASILTSRPRRRHEGHQRQRGQQGPKRQCTDRRDAALPCVVLSCPTQPKGGRSSRVLYGRMIIL